MSENLILMPKTDSPPARIKDSGIINLVKAGKAVYNAKSGELLLLPEGEIELSGVKTAIAQSLWKNGFQKVGCGSDEAIFSLAERFSREWGESGRLFCEERGREIRIISWENSLGEACSRLQAVINSIQSDPGIGVFTFIEDVTNDDERAFVMISRCEAGDVGSRGGFFCPACGSLRFPDSPIDYVPSQPGAGEAEGTLEDVETPGANTITELCSQLSLEVPRTLKAMLYAAADAEGKRHAVASFVRGDYNLSMIKLAKWLEHKRALTGLRSADKSELHELIGEVAGYCGPVGMPPHVVMVGDNSLVGAKNTVAGANRQGYHRKGCCHPRDFDPPIADIAELVSGTPCSCGELYEPCFFREIGVLSIKDASKTEKHEIKKLSYRDREGAHEFPFVTSGSISAERLIMARHSNAF